MTRLVKIGPQAIKQAAALVMRGKLVAYPTDTVYGLGCDPFNESAIRKLTQAKKRKQGRLPLLVDSLGRAEEIGRFDPIARVLAIAFWPGPLTLVVPARTKLPESVTGSTGSVGLRIPHRKDTVDLVRACGGVLVGTSANISGNSSLTTARKVVEELDGSVKLILDGGVARPGIESSVVRIEAGDLSILREKAIPRDRIMRAMQTRLEFRGW